MEISFFMRLILVHILQHIFRGSHVLCNSFITIDPGESLIRDGDVTITLSTFIDDSSHIVIIWLYLQSSLDAERFLARRNLFVAQKGVTETIASKFRLSTKLVYYDSRYLEDPTDFFAKNIRVKSCIYDTVRRQCMEGLADQIIIPLNPPLRRNKLNTYCPAWSLHLKKSSRKQIFPTCQNIADIIKLTGTQLAVSGKRDHGFVKTLPPLKWPKHVPKQVKDQVLSHPKFTVEFRVYILEECLSDFCEILAHRLSLKFLSPVILLNRKGLLHVQIHDRNDAGEAFVTNSPVPLRQWIHVVLMLDGNQTQLSISTESGYQKYGQRFREIAFNSEMGVWNIGGYYGFSGFRGMICCVRMHRRKSLQPEELPHKEEDMKSVQEFDVPGLVKRCALIRGMYRSMLKKYSNHTAVCYPNSFAQCYLKNNQSLSKTRRKQQLSKDLKESFKVFETFIKSLDSGKMLKRDVIAKELNLLGFKKVMYSTNLAAHMFEISGCLGYLESFLATSLAQYFQPNISSASDLHVSSWELYAAMYDNELSQLALSYKHQLGRGGMQQDGYIAAGYAKAAALSVKKILENEERYIHTHTELIRLDEAPLFAGKRGMSSDVMKWLRHQADWGSMSAQSQMAEILFHGQHGVNAQRNEAINLYRAGALQGDANSMYNLGVLHLRGIEVEQNESIAIDLFKKAAKKNLTIAFNSLGYHELVNRKNISGALHYWEIASDLGDKDAMANLGIQYENGVPGVLEADKKKAFGFFKKAANKGQKDGCIRYADHLISGEAEEQNEIAAVRYYRFVAEQLPTIGLYLRNGFDSYQEGNWNTSLLMYMLVSETGLALASFNTALLCDEMQTYKMNVGTLGENCSLHFYNLSSLLGWPASIIRMGDEYWYGKRVPVNRTKAAINYAWIASTQESPEALFNLGFMIENNYSLDGINFDDKKTNKRGNLTLAKIFYERCQLAKQDYGNGYFPCTIALVNLKLKTFFREQMMTVALFILTIIAFVAIVFMSDDEIY